MPFENSHIFQPSPVLDLEGLGRMFYIASPSATSFPGDDDGGDVDDDDDGDGGDDDDDDKRETIFVWSSVEDNEQRERRYIYIYVRN